MSEDMVVGAYRDGARAVMLRNSHEHVQMVVRREFEALTMRRGVRRLEASLRESERRCEALLDSSRDPIAFVHEGMHVRANKAYLEMFGFEDFEDVEGMSILDMIAPDDADDFKALLKKLNEVNTTLGLGQMPQGDPDRRGAGDIAFVSFIDGLVGMGAAGRGSHAPGETADLSSFDRQAKRAALLMTRLSKEPRAKR